MKKSLFIICILFSTNLSEYIFLNILLLIRALLFSIYENTEKHSVLFKNRGLFMVAKYTKKSQINIIYSTRNKKLRSYINVRLFYVFRRWWFDFWLWCLLCRNQSVRGKLCSCNSSQSRLLLILFSFLGIFWAIKKLKQNTFINALITSNPALNQVVVNLIF